MITQLTLPGHYIVSQGRLLQDKENIVQPKAPKIIDYKHTIRVITPYNCNHEAQIEQLKKENQLKLAQKGKEIQQLKKVIGLKDDEILKLNEEINKLQEKYRQKPENKLTLSMIQQTLNHSIVIEGQKSIIASSANERSNQKRRQSFLGVLVPDTVEEDNEQILKVKMEMKNTETALCNVTNLLQKPKKKYQFFNAHLQQKNIKPQTLMMKPLDQTRHFMSETVSENASLNSSINQSFDQSSTDESKDTNDFLNQALNQHVLLRKTLVNLQLSTQQQISQMRGNYQRQIRIYKELLKGQVFKDHDDYAINSSKVNSILDDQQFCRLMPIGRFSNSLFDDKQQRNILDDD